MKKQVFFGLFILFFFIHNIFPQQKAEEIKLILDHFELLKKNSDAYYDSVYLELQEQTLNSHPVDKAIWHSFMAQFLANFHQNNYYEIISRTSVEGEKGPDFKMWDHNTFLEEITYHYNQSLDAEEALKLIDIQDYAILMDSMYSVRYRPTLYDFLAFRALDFFSNDYRNAGSPLLSDAMAFCKNESFIDHSIPYKDTHSIQYQALKLMQDITRFHLSDKNTVALIDITLRRLKYVCHIADILKRDSMYINTLTELGDHFSGQPGYEDIAYAIGSFYEMKGNTHNPTGIFQKENYNKKGIEWFQKCIDFAPESAIAKSAKSQIDYHSKKAVWFSLQQTVIPLQPNLISYEYSNCDSIYVRILSTSLPEYMQLVSEKENDRNFYKKLLQLDYVYDYVVPVPNVHEYSLNIADDTLPALPVGEYYIVLSPSSFAQSENNFEGYAGTTVDVSNIHLVYRNNDREYRFLVTDRLSGKPLKKTKITAEFLNYYDEKIMMNHVVGQTDDHGSAILIFPEEERPHRVKITVEYKKERYTFPSYIYRYRPKIPEATEKIQLFTDKAIYRPGQTVHFKGIVVEKTSDNYRTKANSAVSVEFFINGQSLHTESFQSNEYGSFSGSFVIPNPVQTGKLLLKANQNSHYVAIEEYKTPQFEVIIEEPAAKNYKLKEEVSLKGSAVAFFGYPIEGASVSYRVERYPHYPIWYPWRPTLPPGRYQLITEGETKTDSMGQFEINFVAMPEKKYEKDQEICYQYRVVVDVTDIGGETNSGSVSFHIGQTSMYIKTHFLNEIVIGKGLSCLKVTAEDLNGKVQPAIIDFQLIPLKKPAVFLHEKKTNASNVPLKSANYLKSAFSYLAWENESNPDYWDELPGKITGTLHTAKDSCLPVSATSSLKEGYYKCIFSTKDFFGEEVKMEQVVLFYREKSKEAAAYEPLWITANAETAKPGEKVIFTIGSYLKNATVFFQIISNEGVLLEEWISLSQNRKEVSIPVTEKMKGELIAYAFVCQNGFSYVNSHIVDIPDTDKILDFEWITFRNHLLPGEKEEWKIKIKGQDGKNIVGELLCSMYDASLDIFQSNHFNITSMLDKKRFSYSFYFAPEMQTANHRSFSNKYPVYYRRNYYQLDWNPYPGNAKYKSRGKYPIANNSLQSIDRSFDEDSQTISQFQDNNIFFTVQSSSPEKTATVPSLLKSEFRSNFNETAFFYPQLEADVEGNISFSFTVPENLTRWKLQGVAHTKDLKTGTFEEFVVTNKPLMIVPNTPRFFREGDTIIFSSKVVNMSDELLRGKVTLQLFDAIHHQFISEFPAHLFVVEKGNSVTVDFTFPVPMGTEAITYRIMASSDSVFSGTERTKMAFSDGEEKTLPVLPNRILVTESMPLYVPGESKKSFLFEKMEKSNSSTLENVKYTLEFSSNPAWYAVLSLPYLMEQPSKCNEHIFSKVYANSIALHILNSYPEVKQIVDAWKNLTPNVFLSNLEKNEELKNIVLRETPWVMNAQDETARKQQVGVLFDMQRMSEQNNIVLNQLQNNQNDDGGWSWFPKGKSDAYITSHIVAGFGHLKMMDIESNLKESTLRKAVSYMDKDQYETYQVLKRDKDFNPKGNYLNPDITYYCYSRNFYLKEIPLTKEQEEMYEYYTEQMRKNWKSLSFYSQATAALALHGYGDVKTAQAIVKDIKKQAQYSEEMGMFWKKGGDGWLWHEASIEQQAMLIEAFFVIANDHVSVEKMQQWLLRQKQTQNWGTTRATTEACYALFFQGTESLQTSSGVKISVGNHHIDVDRRSDTEAGIGYFKSTWAKNDIRPDMSRITIEKSSDGMAWGGVYWQYFEELDKITAAQTPLSVKKELYKVSFDERGEVLIPITEDQPIKVGNKVRVRIEIRTDRDMEYIHLKDMRAASFESVNVFSGYKKQGLLHYYESARSAATDFFFDFLPKGAYVFEYTLVATQAGTFSNGITTLQSMYAPEFSAHSRGVRVKVIP